MRHANADRSAAKKTYVFFRRVFAPHRGLYFAMNFAFFVPIDASHQTHNRFALCKMRPHVEKVALLPRPHSNNKIVPRIHAIERVIRLEVQAISRTFAFHRRALWARGPAPSVRITAALAASNHPPTNRRTAFVESERVALRCGCDSPLFADCGWRWPVRCTQKIASVAPSTEQAAGVSTQHAHPSHRFVHIVHNFRVARTHTTRI